MRYLLCLLICVTPYTLEAAVTFSEIAWMGDNTSANQEWIELYNSGDSSVDVTGWTISDGANLNITLAGTIGSLDYVVLERNRSSGVYLVNPPFMTYTGALVNTGTTLTLRRADASIEDQVAGGADWESIGGDNSSKETAQYSVNGWLTAPATPGVANATVGTVPDDEEEEEEEETDDTDTPSASTTSTTANSSTRKGSSKETIRLVLPNTVLKLSLDVQPTAYVNQMIPLRVTPSGISEAMLDSLVYHWNFGDLGTSSRKDPKHVYRYPGTYVITLEASYGRHRQIASTEITILPVTITVARTSAGDIQIHNNAPYDIDISGYTLTGSRQVVFPPHSIIAARGTVTVPGGRVTGIYGESFALRDASALAIASWPPAIVPVTFTPDPVIASTPAPRTVAASTAIPPATGLFTFAGSVVATSTATTSPAIALAPAPAPVPPLSPLAESGSPSDFAWPYVGLALIIGLATVGVVVSRPKSSSNLIEI